MSLVSHFIRYSSCNKTAHSHYRLRHSSLTLPNRFVLTHRIIPPDATPAQSYYRGATAPHRTAPNGSCVDTPRSLTAISPHRRTETHTLTLLPTGTTDAFLTEKNPGTLDQAGRVKSSLSALPSGTPSSFLHHRTPLLPPCSVPPSTPGAVSCVCRCPLIDTPGTV